MNNVKAGKYIELCESIEEKMFDIALQEIEGKNEKEAEDYLMYYAIPSSGSVTKLIYHCDTEPIGCEYYSQIMEVAKEMCGERIDYEHTKTLNDLVWFAWDVLILENEENIEKIIKIAKERGIIDK